MTQEIGYRGTIPTKFLSWRGIEINEQLSLRNSLNAPLLSDELDELCFSHNVYARSIEINEQLSQRNSLNAFCYRLN